MSHTIRTSWVHTQYTQGGDPLYIPLEDSLSVLGDFPPSWVKGSPNKDDNFASRDWIETPYQIVDSYTLGSNHLRRRGIP